MQLTLIRLSNNKQLIMAKTYSSISVKTNKQSHLSNRSSLNYLRTPVGQTSYLPLTNDDLIYYGNLSRCMNQQFKLIIHKITKDLNILLHFQEEDFWIEIQQSDSLRKCLESCLQIFPKKSYGVYFDKQSKHQQSYKITQITKQQSHKTFGQLMRIVLFVYHRMVSSSYAISKDIIYDEWMLDIPKMFNIIRIYKQSNPDIVKEILNCVLKIPNYIDDIADFVSIVKEIIIEALFSDLKFQYTQKIIGETKNFSNPYLSFTRNLIKIFYLILDVYSTLLDFVQNFPTSHSIIMICQPDLLIKLIDGYFQYVENVNGKWQLTKEFKIVFGAVIETVRQKIIDFLLKTLNILDFILQKEVAHENWNKCLRVYFSICKKFIYRNNSPYGPLWQSLVNILMMETNDRQFFRLEKFFQKKLTLQQISVIKECRKYEKEYIQLTQFKQFNKEEILEFKLNSIISMKQWEDFQNYPSFDSMRESQINFDSTICQDSVLDMIEKEFVKKKKKKVTYKQKQSLYEQKSQKKKFSFPDFQEQQYNDQPQFDDEEDEFEFNNLMGRQPFEEECNNYELKYPDNNQINQNQNNFDVKQDAWGNHFVKNKKIDNYSYYYNKVNNDANYNYGNKKTKKKYIALNDLSIPYQKNDGNVVHENDYNNDNKELEDVKQKGSNFNVEKSIERQKNQVFKSHPSKPQQKEAATNNFSISIQQKDETDNNISIALKNAIEQANYSFEFEGESKMNLADAKCDLDNDADILEMLKQLQQSKYQNVDLEKLQAILQGKLIYTFKNRKIDNVMNSNNTNLSYQLKSNQTSLSISTVNNQLDEMNYKTDKSINTNKNQNRKSNEKAKKNSTNSNKNGRNKKKYEEKCEDQPSINNRKTSVNTNNDNKPKKLIYGEKW